MNCIFFPAYKNISFIPDILSTIFYMADRIIIYPVNCKLILVISKSFFVYRFCSTTAAGPAVILIRFLVYLYTSIDRIKIISLCINFPVLHDMS